MTGKRDSLKGEVGKRVAQIREALDLSQTQLAHLLDDVTPSKLNNWERGRDLFPIAYALDFQRLLKEQFGIWVSLDWLYSGRPDEAVSFLLQGKRGIARCSTPPKT